MGSIPYLSTRLFIDVLWVLQDGVRLSQLHKSKTVYVDGVASRYTNSRTYGVAWFWLQYTSFTENSPNYNSKVIQLLVQLI
jgi:hypothetical protein